MSKIDELLKNEKVEWKKLGEVFDVKTGYTPAKSKKEYWTNGTVDWFTIQDIRDKGRILDHANVKVSSKAIKKSTFKANSIVLSTIATIGEHALITNDFIINQQFMVFTKKEKYEDRLNMYFANFYFYKIANFCILNKRVGNVPTVDSNIILKQEIPIPSLKTQEEIVKILDNFTECVTELQAELQKRTKQYEYYRDDLLSEDSLKKLSDKLDSLEDKEYELENLRLEDIVKIKNGKDWKKLNKGNIPVYGSGGYMDVNVDKCSYDKPSVLIPRKGSIENVFYLDKAFWNVDTIFYTEIDESKIIPKYFYYFMKTVDLNALSTNTTRPSLTQDILNKIKINLPPLEVQSKVVEVLDKFQNLLSETQGLLPKEIEERQKQYEYYREKLLTFEDISDFKASKQASNNI